MTERWASEVRGDKWLQRPQEQEAIRVIQQLLESKTEPQVAAEKLASIYEARIKSGKNESYYLWTIIFEAIDQLGDKINNLKHLSKMIICMSKLPDVLDDHGEPIRSDINKRIYWREMPGFAFYLGEATMEFDYTEGRKDKTWKSEMRKYTNGNIFAALYLRDLDENSSKEFGLMRHYCLSIMRVALEVATDTPEQIRRTEIHVPQAARWIDITGCNIYNFSRANLNSTGENIIQVWIGGEDGGPLVWTGADGFSVERWTFWRKRFGEIARFAVKEEVKKLAAQAAEEMEKIEKRTTS